MTRQTQTVPLFRETANGLVFDHQTRVENTTIKTYRDAKAFFKNASLKKDILLYRVYRGVALKKDIALFKKNGFRYDITMIYPRRIGDEATRTIGHTHTKNKEKVGYPEVYQVLKGRGAFLIQQQKTNILFIISAKKDDTVIIPPGCAHSTVNASPKESLIVANIFIDKKNAQQYNFFKKTHGPLWYPVWKNAALAWERNWNYKETAKPIHGTSKKLKNARGQSLYRALVNNPKTFAFLGHPEHYLTQLAVKNLYSRKD
ncbi:MAG: hypothetical protein KBC26_02235 [Candidatus Pacebacteria bacterium]|nr:hypothetical protein [Candidatus Paceibacterota bacterium]